MQLHLQLHLQLLQASPATTIYPSSHPACTLHIAAQRTMHRALAVICSAATLQQPM
jgi:hypothetical protein